MAAKDDEEERLRAVALRNAQGILAARRQAEEELRRQSEWLRVTLASIGDAVISTDARGRVTFLNGVAEALTGWTRAEALGRPLPDVFRIVNEETRQPAENPALRALREGTVVGLANHTVLIARDGTERPIDDSAAPIRDESGAAAGAVLVFRDVTERRRAEALLRHREAELRDFVENATVGLHWVGPDGTILWANRAELELLGYAKEEYVGRNIVEFHADRPVIDDILRRLLNKEEIYGREARLRCKDGSVRHVLINSSGLWEGERFLHTRCFTHDITDRKRAEEARARLAAIVESSEDAIVSKTLDGVITSWNRGAECIFGYTAGEAVGRSITLIIPPERLAEEEAILARLRRGERVEHFETVRVAKDGRRVDISLTVSPVRDAGGRIVGASKVARDVTERRRAEEAVRAAEAAAAAVLESINEGYVVLDADWNFAYVNAAFERMNGVRRQDILGKNHWEVYPATVGTPLEAAYRRVAATGEAAEFENYYPPWDRWFAVKAYPARGGGLCVQVRELTQAKRAEAALRESDEKLRLLADTIPQLAWMARPDGHIFWYNRRWYEYTGTTPEQMEGWGWQSVHDPAVLPAVLGRWKASLASGEPFDMVFPLRGADGHFRPFLTRVNPLRDAGGRTLYWFGTNTDISEQKRAEEGSRFLAEASATLAAVVDDESTLARVAGQAVPFFADWCAVDVARPDGSLRRLAAVHADPSRAGPAEELSRRYPPRADDPHGPARVVRGGEPELVAEVTDALPADRDRDGGHLRLLRELGLGSYLCVPLAARGRVLGTLTFARSGRGRPYDAADLTLAVDLASRAAVATENARLYRELRDADARKDEFLATLAHELRNPLAPIRNALQVLQLSDDRRLRENAREVMQRQVAQMVRLVDDLLDVSRISRNKLELRRCRVELAAVLGNAVETSRPLIDAAGHRLAVKLPPEPVYLDADLTRLAQVFWNLLNNAARYTDPGGRIDLEAEAHDGEVVVTVRDTGVGIPAEELPRLFEMFSQVDRTLERSQGGLGIGLALVKGLVAMHGGTVEAASGGPGKGSAFAVRLPTVRSGPPPAPAPAGGGAPAGPRRRILVVDDSRDAAASLAAVLSLWGHDTRTAHDGLEALELAEAFRPEVILLDLGLPRLNGYDACRRLRERPGTGGAFIVATTGWGQEEDRRRSREAGFDHHLVKPVDLEALRGLLRELPAGRPA